MIIGLIRKETKKEFLGINIPFDNFQRHCKFGYYSVCISIVWLAICRNIPNFLWVGLIRNNIRTVINFEKKITQYYYYLISQEGTFINICLAKVKKGCTHSRLLLISKVTKITKEIMVQLYFLGKNTVANV